MRTTPLVLALAGLWALPAPPARAQICGSPEILVVVRDASGRIVPPERLRLRPVSGNDNPVYAAVEDRALEDGGTPTSVWRVLSATCTLHVTALVLRAGEREMRLELDVSLSYFQAPSRLVVEAPRFRAGRFRATPTAGGIAATAWTRVEE